MKAVRIFLLVLIIIGIALIVFQSLWVPRVVDAILKYQGLLQTQSQANKIGNSINFTALPTSGGAPLGVSFTITNLVWNDTGSLYAIDFGDGVVLPSISSYCSITGSTCRLSHTYSSIGVYTAKFYVGKILEGSPVATTMIAVHGTSLYSATLDRPNPYSLPSAPFTLTGTISPSPQFAALTVVLAATKATASTTALYYEGASDWKTTSNLSQNDNRYVAISSSAQVEALANGGVMSVWSAPFNGLPEGDYSVFIYDPTHNLVGTSAISVVTKGL